MNCDCIREELKKTSPTPRAGLDLRDRGFTLVEVLVAVTILSLGVVAALGALATSVWGSGLNRNQADLDSALVTAEEIIKATPYQPCNGSDPAGTPYTNSAGYTQIAIASGKYVVYPNPSPVPGAGFGYFEITVQYWNGTGSTFNGYPSNSWATVSGSSGCLPAVSPSDDELVTITGFSPDHQANQTIAVVKGNWS